MTAHELIALMSPQTLASLAVDMDSLGHEYDGDPEKIVVALATRAALENNVGEVKADQLMVKLID